LFEYFVFFELVNLVPKGTEDLFVDVFVFCDRPPGPLRVPSLVLNSTFPIPQSSESTEWDSDSPESNHASSKTNKFSFRFTQYSASL